MSGWYIARLIWRFMASHAISFARTGKSLCVNRSAQVWRRARHSGMRGRFGCEVRMTLIRHVPSCDELCLSPSVSVLPVRRRFLPDRPGLADGSPGHCSASRKIVRSYCRRARFVACGSSTRIARQCIKRIEICGKVFVIYGRRGYNMYPRSG
jgi:hypothetical protein